MESEGESEERTAIVRGGFADRRYKERRKMRKDKLEEKGCLTVPEESGAESENTAAEGLPSREEEFNALITGKFKDLFDKAVEEAVKANRSDKKSMEKEISEKASRRYEKWLAEARETRSVYPGFDLGAELKNEQFCELLKCGVPVKSAYELIHRDELFKLFAKEMEENITKRILAGTLRPKEAAISGSSGTVIKSDAAHMSKNARQEIIRRVQRGEKISF